MACGSRCGRQHLARGGREKPAAARVCSARARLRSIHGFVGSLMVATLLVVARAVAKRGRRAPGRFPGIDRVQRPRPPDGRALLARWPGLRGGEERSDQGVRQPRRHDADPLRRPQHERLQLLGSRPARSRARPRVPVQPYVYVLYSYDHELRSSRPRRAELPACSPIRARPRRGRPRTAAS